MRQASKPETRNADNIVVPPLKWAGGKRWFVARVRRILPDYNRYIEPFLGSGAMFFALRPQAAILSDVNAELINAYAAIRDRPDLVRRYLAAHARCHSKRHYYRTRDETPRSPSAQSARTLYLNRTCWNGLYRVNRDGRFNVPKGTKNSVILPTDDFRSLSRAFSDATLLISDFEPVIDQAASGDFVFIDPPYTVAHNTNGFIKYNERLFCWADQERLRSAVDRAVSRGARVLITNANHRSVRALYAGYKQRPIYRNGVIAAASEKRSVVDELLIKCW